MKNLRTNIQNSRHDSIVESNKACGDTVVDSVSHMAPVMVPVWNNVLLHVKVQINKK